MFEIKDSTLTNKEVENLLIEKFGDMYLSEAMRIVSTRVVLPFDDNMIYEAMCIIVALYSQKVKDGEINKDKVMH